MASRPARRASSSSGWETAGKLLLLLAGLTPFALLIISAILGELGADPIKRVTHQTGWWALTFLMATLAVTPIRLLSRQPWLGRYRRMIGLFAFFYCGLHLLTYLALDQYFAWHDILEDVTKRPYITVGFGALLLLIPLAVTSSDRMIRRLGGLKWRRLHRLIYPSAALGVIHFWWLVKKDIREPLLFAVALTVLLGFRLINAARPGLLSRPATTRKASPEVCPTTIPLPESGQERGGTQID